MRTVIIFVFYTSVSFPARIKYLNFFKSVSVRVFYEKKLKTYCFKLKALEAHRNERRPEEQAWKMGRNQKLPQRVDRYNNNWPS